MAPFSVLSLAPLFPDPRAGEATPSSGFQLFPVSLRRAAARAANFMIATLQLVVKGEVGPSPVPGLGSFSEWRKAGSRGQEVSEYVLHQVAHDWRESGDFATGEATGSRDADRLCFRRIASKLQGDYGARSHTESAHGVDAQGRPILARGALADGPLSELALPPRNLIGRRAAEMSSEVEEFFALQRDLVLVPE